MCGIVGFIKENCLADLYEGLKMLEYRGYDSVGVAFLRHNQICIRKKKGRIQGLRRFLYGQRASCGMGHTRWATHGAPTTRNAHPHCVGGIAVVHNGIIANYHTLRTRLEAHGERFSSDTDTEVIVHLLYLFVRREGMDMLTAIRHAVSLLEGSWAVAVMDEREEDCVYLFKKDNPLIVGQGEGFYCFASDTPALVRHTHTIYKMADGQIACLRRDSAHFWQGEAPIVPTFCTTNLCVADVQLGAYPSYMAKEMAEIPMALRRTWRHIASLSLPREALQTAKRWVLAGCGTAYHACLCATQWLKEMGACACVCSEMEEMRAQLDEDTVMVAVSQSGETADTLQAVRLAKAQGAYVVGVTNVPDSGLTTLADWVMVTEAGAEIAVAATKSYTTQLLALRLLASVVRPMPDPTAAFGQMEALQRALPTLDRVAKTDVRRVFLLGKGRDYATCLEGALKIKEVAYLDCDTCYTGEIKHGPLACVHSRTLVILLCTDSAYVAKSRTALHEVRTRGAKTLVLTQDASLAQEGDWHLILPDLGGDWAPMVAVLPLQYLAYRLAVVRHLDADKPRNLAKSVTVE